MDFIWIRAPSLTLSLPDVLSLSLSLSISPANAHTKVKRKTQAQDFFLGNENALSHSQFGNLRKRSVRSNYMDIQPLISQLPQNKRNYASHVKARPKALPDLSSLTWASHTAARDCLQDTRRCYTAIQIFLAFSLFSPFLAVPYAGPHSYTDYLYL